MDQTDIVTKINGFLVEEFEVELEKITPSASVRDTLGLDSLDYIDLAVVIESNFGFKVKHQDFATINTFQSLWICLANVACQWATFWPMRWEM